MVWLGVHTMTQTEGDATTGRVLSPTGAVFAKLNANDKEHAKHTSAVSELILGGEVAKELYEGSGTEIQSHNTVNVIHAQYHDWQRCDRQNPKRCLTASKCLQAKRVGLSFARNAVKSLGC